jgi:hypothetical protein
MSRRDDPRPPLAVGVDPGGDHDRDLDDPATLTDLIVNASAATSLWPVVTSRGSPHRARTTLDFNAGTVVARSAGHSG